jgi:hypothetical protein
LFDEIKKTRIKKWRLTMTKEIIIFENSQIRRHYDTANEVWYFSLVDIVGALTDSVNATDYLKKNEEEGC